MGKCIKNVGNRNGNLLQQVLQKAAVILFSISEFSNQPCTNCGRRSRIVIHWNNNKSTNSWIFVLSVQIHFCSAHRQVADCNWELFLWMRSSWSFLRSVHVILYRNLLIYNYYNQYFDSPRWKQVWHQWDQKQITLKCWKPYFLLAMSACSNSAACIVDFMLSGLCKSCFGLSFSLCLLLNISFGLMWWQWWGFINHSWVCHFIFCPSLNLTLRDDFKHGSSRVSVLCVVKFLPVSLWYISILNAWLYLKLLKKCDFTTETAQFCNPMLPNFFNNPIPSEHLPTTKFSPMQQRTTLTTKFESKFRVLSEYCGDIHHYIVAITDKTSLMSLSTSCVRKLRMTHLQLSHTLVFLSGSKCGFLCCTLSHPNIGMAQAGPHSLPYSIHKINIASLKQDFWRDVSLWGMMLNWSI